ncbi:MAG: hypothetical protein U1F52_15685 [Burkholderiales bacterium]
MDEYLKIIEQQRARIERLEQLLALNHVAIPPREDALSARAPGHLDFPALDFSEPSRKPPEAVQITSALEGFPHITSAITSLWGKDGFDEYLGKLIVDERGTRKGFTMDAMEELLFLARVARYRKALFGMGFDRKPTDVWHEVKDLDRRAAKPAP